MQFFNTDNTLETACRDNNKDVSKVSSNYQKSNSDD